MALFFSQLQYSKMTIITAPSMGARFALVAVLAVSAAFCLWKSHSLRHRRRRRRHHRSSSIQLPDCKSNKPAKIFFASQTGTSEFLARRLAARLSAAGLPADLVDPRHYEPEDLPKETVILIVASTWEKGEPPPNAAFLARWLAESAADFRVGSLMLSHCQFAVFGVGSRAYGPTFNAAARDFARWMKELGAAEMMLPGDGDVDGGEVEKEFDLWSERILRLMKGERSLGGGARGDAVDELEEGVEYDDEEEEEDVDAAEDDVVDLEDIAGKAPSRKTKGELVNGDGGIKEMVTPIIRKNLEKQVEILGSYFI